MISTEGAATSRRHRPIANERGEEPKISRSVTPRADRRKRDIDCRDSVLSIPCHATRTATVRMYLRIRPDARDDGNVYTVLNPTALLTRFPSFEETAVVRDTRHAKSCGRRRHAFTEIYGSETSQPVMFERSIKHRVADFVGGESSTVMAYGARDSGKTHTLFGSAASPGVIPRSIEHVFAAINCTLTPWYKPTRSGSGVLRLDEYARLLEARRRTRILNGASMNAGEISTEARRSVENSRREEDEHEECNGESMYAVWLSCAEIYNGNVYDLLDDAETRSPLELTADNEGRVYVCGLQRVYSTTALEACQILVAGRSRMTTGATSLNRKGSSRSHTVFTMKLLRYQKDRAADEVTLSTLTFCDLAGSAQFKTQPRSSDIREACSINNSLLVLGRCLKAVSQNRIAPFRDSKLTRIFQGALSGQENLILIANVVFAASHYAETQNTFNFCAIVRRLLTDSGGGCERSRGFVETISSSTASGSDVIASSSSILEVSPVATIERIDSVTACEDLREQNRRLMRELEDAKSDTLNREYAIRQELADYYSTIIGELETTHKERAKNIEVAGCDLLKWSVRQFEGFCKERIDDLTRHKKRKRRDSGDHVDDNRALYEELAAENAQVASKVTFLKEAVKKLRDDNRANLCERNKCSFELALVTEELRKFRELARAAIRKRGGDDEGLGNDAELLMSSLERSVDEEMRRYGTKTKEQIAVSTPLATESSKGKSFDLSDIDRGSSCGVCADCGVLRSSESRSRDDSGISSELGGESRRSDRSIRETEERYTQTPRLFEENDLIASCEHLIEQRADYATRQDVQETLRAVELSEALETIGDVIYVLNEAACVNERKITRYECQSLRKEGVLEQLIEEKREITIKCNDLSKMIESRMLGYKGEIAELTRRLAIKEENECQTFKYLQKYLELSKSLESQLSLMRAQLDQVSGKCANEHLPRIQSLEEEVLRKVLRISELDGKLALAQRDRDYELFEKVGEWQRHKNELHRQLYECSVIQSGLGDKLKELTVRIADRERTIASLRTEVRNVAHLNASYNENERYLSERIAEMRGSIGTAKDNLRCCEELRKSLENVMSREADELRSRLADIKDNTALFNEIRKIARDNSQDVVSRSKARKSRDRERKIIPFRCKRDAATRRYETLTRRHRHEIKDKHLKAADTSNGLERSLGGRERVPSYVFAEFLRKFRTVGSQGRTEESYEIRDRDSANGVGSTSKMADVDRNEDSASTRKRDVTDTIKCDDAECCQTENSVTSNAYTSVHEADSSETEIDLRVRASDTKNKRKILSWMKIRRIHGKIALSRSYDDKHTDIDSNTESE